MNYSIRRPLSLDEQHALAGYSPLLSHLLFHRGVRDAIAAGAFTSPDYEAGLHDPFLLKDAEKAADRIVRAIEQDEKIAIYADYDADGIPGAAMFNDFFKRIGFANYLIYIPHRHNEGFGVNSEAVKHLAEQGVKLLITVDCGISDFVPLSEAKNRGLDVIVTDHHEPQPPLPPAFAILDHRQAGCSYPDKNLCGSAVAFKLIQAVLKKNQFGLKEGAEKWFLDLVGIATLSDMVPLTGENRILAHYGLAVLRKSPRKGLVQLFRKLNLDQRHLSEDDIAFMITPRLNAASRMGVPMDAFNLLAADSDTDAYVYAEHLDRINNERKGVVASLVKEVKKTVRERHGALVPSVIVLGNPAWRPALLGLAANSCAEEFRRPVFLWGRDGDNMIKGSCRSEGTTHVVELMQSVPVGVFSQFGGHRHSGGFTVDNEGVHFLEQRLNDAYEESRERVAVAKVSRAGGDSDDKENDDGANDDEKGDEEEKNGEEQEGETIDAELALDGVTAELYEDINKLSPFGKGNPKPLFLFRNVIPSTVRRFGKASEHVELKFKQGSGKTIRAISFFGAAQEWAKGLQGGAIVDLIASVEKSTYRNRNELRLRIADIVQ
ncbi:MAG: single-stranded-DNA-specific exonuclease [Candidatus Parcubacteria bacterium]|jgi:single-stranded-DNA-specific exonuclease|nr:single-stranded-DNA-specific exonuclease [Candidatus Parcubacteria bacterium]